MIKEQLAEILKERIRNADELQDNWDYGLEQCWKKETGGGRVMSMKELDVVKLKKDFEGVCAGTKGAIVLEYDGTTFEVEFFNQDGQTVAVLTVPAGILELAE